MDLPYRKHIRGENNQWVVLINGLFADQDSWNESLNFLNNYNVLTYNGRGQGDAPRLTESYTLGKQINDLIQLLNHTGLEKFILIGLSNGGRVAMKFASLFPNKVEKLIVSGTYGNLSPLLSLKINSWLEAHNKGGAQHRFDVAAPWIWSESVLEKNPDLISIYREKSKKSDEQNIVNLISGALTGNVDVGKIQMPTLLLAGKEDLLTPVTHHNELASKIPDAKLKVVKGGHACLIEYPSIVKETIIPFIEEIE